MTVRDHASDRSAPAGRVALTALAWLWVAVPFAYGVWQLMIKVVQLFS